MEQLSHVRGELRELISARYTALLNHQSVLANVANRLHAALPQKEAGTSRAHPVAAVATTPAPVSAPTSDPSVVAITADDSPATADVVDMGLSSQRTSLAVRLQQAAGESRHVVDFSLGVC